jgi:hypothetical protein
MSRCPIDAYKTFQTLSGPLTDIILKTITVNQSPFFASFAPRTVAPKLIKNGIIAESFGNSMQINNIRYDIVPTIFLIKPIHTGFILPGQQSAQTDMVGEVLFTAKNLNNVVFISIPIYRTQNTSTYSAYLDQLWNPSAPVANLQTLFLAAEGDNRQVCLNYVYCENGLNRNVFVFPRGIQMPATNWSRIMNIAEKLGDLSITAGSVLVCSTDFRNRFQYYTRGVGLIGRFDSGSCPAYNYKTKQYKCVPFDRIRNLDGDTVVFKGAKTLQDTLNEQDAAKKKAMRQVEGEQSGMSAGAIAAIVAGTLVGGIALVYIGSKTAQLMNEE